MPYYAQVYIGEKHWKRVRKGIASDLDSYRSAGMYNNCRKLIDRILAKAEEKYKYKADYKEFDNLLWYYFKGEKSRLNKAYKVLEKLN